MLYPLILIIFILIIYSIFINKYELFTDVKPIDKIIYIKSDKTDTPSIKKQVDLMKLKNEAFNAIDKNKITVM